MSTTLDIVGTKIPKDVFFKAHPNLIKFPVDVYIKEVAFYQWPGSTAISCLITCVNGHEEQNFSRPRQDRCFDLNTGIEAAFMRTRDQLWPLLSFMERQGEKP
jgi:hypothetical protein